MRQIEAKISNLIKRQFPAFYQESGPDLVAFVSAYYEWLEENNQLLTLEDATGFEVGDTVRQGDVTGTIISKENNDVLVHVIGFGTFECVNICTSLVPVTSSSGGDTTILTGGTTKRLGSIFLSRNLMNLADIDTTLDLFISHFKEKYLKNIEFDMSSNKRLLVKHSLDLYRSKGTQRSIDLFFRLIYGVSATVYYPGDDLFKLSGAQWVKPRYIEISEHTVQKAIGMVGKQISGATSGASAFVEKYIKRRINSGDVHVLYISNIRGEFINDELLKSDGQVYIDSPRVVGSLTSVEIVSGSRLFEIGDIVSFESTSGKYGLARVASIDDQTGVVDFILVDGGYGYTDSANSLYTAAELDDRTQSIVSDKVLGISNIVTSNSIANVYISNGGSGYSNNDTVNISGTFTNGVVRFSTNATGGVITALLLEPGAGIVNNTPSYSVANATGGVSSGTGATFTFTTKEPSSYYGLFEKIEQRMFIAAYDSAVNSSLFVAGDLVRTGNASVNTAFGTIISNEITSSTNGILTIATSNGTSFGAANTIRLISNSSVTANVANVTNDSATGLFMGVPETANLTFDAAVGTFARGDEIFQLDSSLKETGNATVSAVVSADVIAVSNLKGIIRQGRTISVRNGANSANVTMVQLSIGVSNVVNNFTDSFHTQLFSNTTGTTADLSSVSQGVGASFKIGTISDTETIYINTDLIGGINSSNVPYKTIKLNASSYGFPKNPLGNSASILYSCLDYDLFTIGTIESLASINPGSEYNVNPYVLAYQPYISGFNRRDYLIGLEDSSGIFQTGERVTQADLTFNTYEFTLTNETGYVLGEKVYQGTVGTETATGTITSITAPSNTVTVANVSGSFANAAVLKSYITPALNANIINIASDVMHITAKGTTRSANSTVLKLKRTQFDNHFQVGQTITGAASGITATIASIAEDPDSLPIGVNADIDANVVTANGSVTSLQIVDSGIGYANGEIMLYTSEDGQRSGEAKAIVSGSGTGSGYYKTSKGFLSSISKVHDGDYYQEYSYDVMSRIPIDKYGAMFKKVMHTAGTRFFGSVLLEQNTAMVVDISSNVSTQTFAQTMFNGNTAVGNGAIYFNNLSGNSQIFVDGEKVEYYSVGGIPIGGISNNGIYYIADSNTTSVKLTTNPRSWSYSFNSNTEVANSKLLIERTNLRIGDRVIYTAGTGNASLPGLSNGSYYEVTSVSAGAVAINASPVASIHNQSGHTISTTAINITAGNGVNHFISKVIE